MNKPHNISTKTGNMYTKVYDHGTETFHMYKFNITEDNPYSFNVKLYILVCIMFSIISVNDYSDGHYDVFKVII